MAYYTALQTEWALLTGTTAAKLAAINALTVSNTANPTYHCSSQQLAECISPGEFALLTPALRMEVLAFLALPFPRLGGATSMNAVMASLYFPQGANPITYAALVGLAQMVAGSSPWWQANGYPAPISYGDLTAAGGLT